MNQKILFFFIFIGFSISVKAQLSDLHYLPPLKQGLNNEAVQQQAIYLSTPEPTTFTVNAYRGTSNTPIATFSISNVSPAVYTLGNGDNNITLVNNANTGIVLNNSGLRFVSPSGNRFYVNYRGYSPFQAASLTSKGRVAMGTHFKWGGVPNLGSHPSKSNTLGIMATEDNTTVNLFGYDPECEFRVGNNRAGITADTYTVTLNANESFVFETYIGNSPTAAHRDGWIGASIVSDKDIVISNGSMNFGREANAGNRDAGIDQPVPENRLGKEYVFVRGNGGTNGATEFPLIIATADNTQIFVNGSTTPIATLNNGDFYEVPSNFYSSNTVGANMFVQTSKDVYAYQSLAGASAIFTQGLNFVAPVNCLLPDVMDNIPDIRNIAGTQVTGGLTIIAATTTPDANIVVTDGSGTVALPSSRPVAGSDDWKTIYIPNLNGNVSVQSTGPIAVGFFGFNGARGVAGYFSGFDTVPEVNLEIRGGEGCFVGSEIFEATGNFDAYQWFGDGVLIPGANGPNYAPTIAGDYFVRGTKGPCTYDSQPIAAYYCDPDVVVNKTVDKPEIMEGETATFTIRVRNLGVGPLTNLRITDNIPNGLTLESSFTIAGSWSGNTWNIGTLEGGGTAILELEVRADEIDTLPLLSLTNTAINSQTEVDTNITEDNPSAKIIIHNDFDNDGVRDIADLDDDNDGIYDEEECDNLAFNISGGSSYSSVSSADDYLILDVFSLDNSFNLQVNGTNVAGEIQFQSGSGNFATFTDGFGYGQNGIPQIYSLTGSHGSPLLRVVIDQLGQFELFGAKTSNGTLEPMVLNTPANTISWNTSGTNTIAIGQAVDGTTNMNGMLQTAGCDIDADDLPNHLDLDSDGDGCTDANEFYKDNNADGGDGGEYGTGTPAVDPDTGVVLAASYIRVFAPEILLGNTTEDLGGTNINGQDVSLGQTIQYVLRFQNTGDDDAQNYTIRDILPANVTLDNVDVSDALGTTFSHDLATNTINFSVPDGLVEVGDPQYSIRITVTIASNCSEFVAACSSQLENRAFSTYQGTLNTVTFTDENGINTISACGSTPEVASNSIFNDLVSCNQARTVQLCGDNAILTAGEGFLTYNWVLDTNGNGTVDSGDTVLNDGDPDGDPSTLVVTAPGDYIVEKSSNGSCPDLVERIRVERFGTTQTNPIVDFFNQVNSDSDPNNDMQGEIATCPIDGDVLPKIFLCGSADENTIQLGITDAESIVWQKLDEGSCSDAGDDCANKNGSCSWNTEATQDNFTIMDSGEYRVVINYLNGCFSRFYFDVFKNNLDLDYNSSDILCSTPGNIRITNVGSGYGFQLVNASNDNIIVPFSANNGPNFDIAASGTYKVQVTQLNPADGTPIDGSCIFETEDIGILERDFQVNLSATPADCNQLGTVEVQVLNVLPNYSYELRLDDGSNGGQGSLVSSQPSINGNTYTFLGVNPDNYLVVTRTDDGCLDSQPIVVDRIEELTLSALTTDNITCTAGVVTLTPGGGQPNPNYEMAIWSKDGVPLYATPSDIPASAIQTTPNFLFGYRGTPSTYFPNEDGDYTFIVMDSNGCHTISNTVRMEDLGSPTVSASHTQITCADAGTSTLTVAVTGGTGPYTYSLDGGTTTQSTNNFLNLSAGIYEITVTDSSGNGTNACTETITYEIDQPFRLTASPSILEDASCSPSGALVKIANPNGGQAPYTFSFDGGSSFGNTDTVRLLAGTHQLAVRDNLGCVFDMEITVPDPVADPSFTQTVTYDCDGLGTIVLTPSNTTDFDYIYDLNDPAYTASSSNTFTDVPANTYTATIAYTSTIAPDQSTLFFEDFGAGPTTQIGEIGPDYCYEPQDGSTTDCNLGPAGILVNGEYTVTNFVTNPIPAWRSPDDHTGLTDGRFLAIDVSTLAGDKGVLWARRGLEVLPNKDITLSFWAYNLMQTSGNGNNPEVLIELLDASGTVISSIPTPEIPKNTNTNDWHNRTVVFNPGVNTVVDIVLRSNLNSDFGNDLIMDDIQASQEPEVCEKTTDITIVVESGQDFEATLLSTIDPSCAGGNDGAVRFDVSNFDAATGFEYSTDGGSTWTTSLISPVTTTANLASGSYTMQVRRIADTSCTASFGFTLTDPSPIVPQLSQVEDFTCFNTGGTLEASATGGNPSYEYQIEDTSGTIIAPYQNDTRFPNITNGDYIVRVRDQNGCDMATTTPITIVAPRTVSFDAVPTACYSGANDGSITVNVTDGNGNYEFRLDGGAWITPTPANATTYTFTGLSNDTYDVEVRDQLGCPVTPNTQSITLSPQLIVTVDVVELSSCNDGSITVNATGGNGTLLYAIVPANSSPTGAYTTTNTLTITEAMATANSGGYDVYVQDNNGSPVLCTFVQEDIILTPVTNLTVNAVATDPLCFNGLGSIEVNVGGGTGPFTYILVDQQSSGDTIDYSRSDANVSATSLTFNGLGVGDYEVTITDANNCSVTSTSTTIANAVEITADIRPLLPANCASSTESDFGFEFENIMTPSGTPGIVQYSNDGGANWQASPELRGTVANPTFSGTEVFPSIRVEVASGVYCQKDFDRYIIPFPLDDLDITLFPQVVDCNDLQVTVRGSNGDNTIGYRYTYTDDPANFRTSTPIWTARIPDGTSHTFANIDPTTPQQPGLPLLVPGRTYVFYVEDGSGCIRQSNVNVNDIASVDLPIEISADITPTCAGTSTGEITFTITPDTAFPNMRWEIYELGNNTPIETSGGNVPFNSTITTSTPLDEGEYFISVTQIEADNTTEACKGASENAYLRELAPLSATAVVTRDISCNLPGLISINGISGGGGAPYTYDVVGRDASSTIIYSATGTTDNPVQIPVNTPAGDYTVTLYDQYSCPVVLNTVALTIAPNPTITVAQDNCSAPITVTATGASAAGNLRYAIVPAGNPVPTVYEDNNGVFTNVSPGTYDVYVMDGNGCTASEVDFEVYPVLSASATLTKVLDCTASPDATINIEILDGSGNYQYSISNTAGAAPVNITNVPGNNFDYQAPSPGDYTITIYDTTTPNSAICNREFVVNVPNRIEPIIDPAILVTNVTCIGANDGTITITTTNGAAAPYTFEITSFDGNTDVDAPGDPDTDGLPIAPTSTTGNSATFTGLTPTTTAGGYIITVTGNAATNNCSVNSTSIQISEPTAITVPTPTVVAFGCSSGNDVANASITVNDVAPFIQGGSGTYIRYEFVEEDDPNTGAVEAATVVQSGTNTTFVETDFAGGVYTINVYDDSGCLGTTTATIQPYDALGTPTIHIDDAISCSNLGEDIALDIVGSRTSFGTDPGNYEFRQLPSASFQASNQFMDLQPGNYTFAVRNRTTGCEITVTHTVADPNTFNVTVNKIADVVCFGDNGSITLTLTDATYAGGFTWQAFNTNGTPADRSDDGTAVSTGTETGTGTTAPINLPGGNYIIEIVQDAFPDCTQIRSFSIATPPAPITLDTVDLRDVGCSNNEGSAAITPLGGQAPYDIQLTNTDTGTVDTATQVNEHLFSGLSAGSYTVMVTDALGCVQTFSDEFELLLPDPISGTTTITNLRCEGDTDGTITMTLNMRNISTTYRYFLERFDDLAGTNRIESSAGQTTNTFGNLGAGFYRIVVQDALGCSLDDAAIMEIEAPDEVRAQLVTQQILSCEADAILELRATGGNAPYFWSLDATGTNLNTFNNGANHTFNAIVANTTPYSYFVYDSNGCISVRSNEITIAPIETLTVTVDETAAFINCNGESSAIITAEANGGLGNYEYGLFADAGLTNEVRPYNATGIFENLPQGDYFVSVLSEDCEVLSEIISISEPEPLVVDTDITDILCFGEENGSITINAQGGSGDYQYAISPNLNQFDDENVFEDLAPGNYSVIVQDSQGCFEFIEFEIVEPVLLEMETAVTPEICAGDEDGTIVVTITGGTAPYSTALNSNNDGDFIEDRMTLENLASGTYVLFVRDANGCTINEIVTVDAGANLNATAAVIYECSGDTPDNRIELSFEDDTVATDVLYALNSMDANDMVMEPNFTNIAPGSHYIAIAHANGCINTVPFEVEDFEPLVLSVEQRNLNEITAFAAGGKEGYTYYFDGQDNGEDGTFYIRRTDTYTVRVVDANGCESSAEIFMEFIDIEIPNFFTPNGDGQNDFWIPRNIAQFPDIFIKIFDRYGREVYIVQDDDEGWDGLYQESDLPSGDYWYIIKLNGADDTREFVGHFTLYR